MDRSVLNEALREEIETITSIYGPETLRIGEGTYNGFRDRPVVLQVPDQPFSFTLGFDLYYPETPPAIRGIESSGNRPKGEGKIAVETLKQVLERVFKPGEVVLFDLIEEAGGALMVALAENDHKRELERERDPAGGRTTATKDDEESSTTPPPPPNELPALAEPPPWVLSDVITGKKSVFVARCVAVTTKEQAIQCLDHLLATHKKVASATHNITAWRIKGENGVPIQDSDDDGETAAGGRLLHLLQLMDAWNVVVVVSRWFGGVKLGPDRFRLINTVAKDALVKGGFNSEQKPKKKGKNSWRPDNDPKR